MKVTLTGENLTCALESIMNNHGYLGFTTVTIEIDQGQVHFHKVLRSIEEQFGICVQVEQPEEEVKDEDTQGDGRMPCAYLTF